MNKYVRLIVLILLLDAVTEVLNAQEIEIPNGGFELIGSIYPTLPVFHPVGWSSNLKEILDGAQNQSVYVNSDSPYEGKHYVRLTQNFADDSVYNPAMHLAEMDYRYFFAYNTAGNGIYTPNGEVVECVSGQYRMKKQSFSDVAATVYLYSELPPSTYVSAETVLSVETENWTSFEVCGSQKFSFGLLNFNHLAIGIVVTGNDYDPAFELDLDDLKVSKYTNIRDTPTENDISVYPNPSGNLITIPNPLNETINWDVLSQEGKLLLQGSGTQVIIESLPYGNYLLQVNNSTMYPFIKD